MYFPLESFSGFLPHLVLLLLLLLLFRTGRRRGHPGSSNGRGTCGRPTRCHTGGRSGQSQVVGIVDQELDDVGVAALGAFDQHGGIVLIVIKRVNTVSRNDTLHVIEP